MCLGWSKNILLITKSTVDKHCLGLFRQKQQTKHGFAITKNILVPPTENQKPREAFKLGWFTKRILPDKKGRK